MGLPSRLMVHHQVQSSTVHSVGYDPQTREMEVTFKRGKTYTHRGVSQEQFDRLKNATSIGQSYRQNFYGKHS